jgi:hypothetical protein
MLARKTRTKILWITALLFATLACSAVTRFVIPDTPTPFPTGTNTPTATQTPTVLPTFTPTVLFEAACPALLADVLSTMSSEITLPPDSSDLDFNKEDSIILITYEVSGDKISGPRNRQVPENLEDERDDRDRHTSIWNYFVSIIPQEPRKLLSEYVLFTDGPGNHLAAVSPTFSDPKQWILHVDILDAKSYYDLTYSLIHEQGHLLTLNAEQVPPSTALLKYPNNKTVYKQEVTACQQYFPGEGCSTPDSYINQFFDRFWPYLYPEWEKIDREEDETTRRIMLEDFYKVYQDQFLTDYAPISPVEDIAESWTFFVLSPKPELNSIANEKILFFYEYPELVELRTQILKQICVEFPQ